MIDDAPRVQAGREIVTVLQAASTACNRDRDRVLTALVGAITTLCACSDDCDQQFAIAQDLLAMCRTMCVRGGA